MSKVVSFESYEKELTEITIETQSQIVLSLCERIRGMEVSESEAGTLDSFLQWARSTPCNQTGITSQESRETSSKVKEGGTLFSIEEIALSMKEERLGRYGTLYVLENLLKKKGLDDEQRSFALSLLLKDRA